MQPPLLPLRAVGHVRGELLAQAVVVDYPLHDSLQAFHLSRKVCSRFKLRDLRDTAKTEHWDPGTSSIAVAAVVVAVVVYVGAVS